MGVVGFKSTLLTFHNKTMGLLSLLAKYINALIFKGKTRCNGGRVVAMFIMYIAFHFILKVPRPELLTIATAHEWAKKNFRPRLMGL